MVQSAAYPWVTSLARAWLTSRLVSEGGSTSSRADGDEGVAEAVEPELGSAGLADAGVEVVRVLDMAGRAGCYSARKFDPQNRGISKG